MGRCVHRIFLHVTQALVTRLTGVILRLRKIHLLSQLAPVPKERQVEIFISEERRAAGVLGEANVW